MKNIFKFGKHSRIWMILGLILLSALLVETIYSQKSTRGNEPQKNMNHPQVDIKVNKKTDKNGNITQYDSTYTWSWSNNGPIPENVDSIFKSMQERFNFNFPKGFSMDFFNDSTFFNHNFNKFFRNDFGNFDKMLEEQEQMIKKYFHNEPILKAPEDSLISPPSKPKLNHKESGVERDEQEKNKDLKFT